MVVGMLQRNALGVVEHEPLLELCKRLIKLEGLELPTSHCFYEENRMGDKLANRVGDSLSLM